MRTQKQIIALALAAISCAASALVQTTDQPVHVLIKGALTLGTFQTHELCVAAAAGYRVNGQFECRPTTQVITALVAGPQPADETQRVACPAGSRPGASWSQTRSYLSAPSPTFWRAGPWMPTTPPASSCLPPLPPPQPPAETQMLSCPAGSSPGSQWQQTRSYVSAPAPAFWTPSPWTPDAPQDGACPPAPPPPTMHAGWPADDSKVDFSVHAGVTDIRIAALVQRPTPAGDNTGAFRTVCYRATMGYFDPIVHPGEDNSSHLHQFFCNDGINPSSTAETLLSQGGSTSRGGAMNKSAVWTPTIIDTLDNSPRPGRAMIVYYKTGFATDHPSTQPVPVGLKMIFGDPSATTFTRWGISGFSCDGNAVANDHDEPFISGQHIIPTKAQCGPGHEVWMTATAPNCWDGVRLDSPNHRDHMAYTSIPWNAQTLPNGCQPDHPILIAQVSALVIVPVGPNDDPGRWVLSSDRPLPAGAPTQAGDLTLSDGRVVRPGVTMHVDYFAHWLPEFQDVWIKNCLRVSLDCAAHMLGDGRTMDSFGGN